MSGVTKLDAIQQDLLKLSHELGRPEHKLAILGEGNTSATVDDETFLIKASGCQLATMEAEHLVQVRFHDILKIMDAGLSDDETAEALLNARVDATALKPSVESTFHGWLLRQKGIKFVGHTHPIEVCKILCSDRAMILRINECFPMKSCVVAPNRCWLIMSIQAPSWRKLFGINGSNS